MDDENFSTASDGQTGAVAEVRENSTSASHDDLKNGLDAGTGTKVGQIEVQFPNPLPKGSRLHITFTMNDEGLLVATAAEPKSGATGKAEIKTASKMSEAELNAAKTAVSRVAVS